jgi:hypothetical protein
LTASCSFGGNSVFLCGNIHIIPEESQTFYRGKKKARRFTPLIFLPLWCWEEKTQFHFDRNVALRMVFVMIVGGRGGGEVPLNYATAYVSSTYDSARPTNIVYRVYKKTEQIWNCFQFRKTAFNFAKQLLVCSLLYILTARFPCRQFALV